MDDDDDDKNNNDYDNVIHWYEQWLIVKFMQIYLFTHLSNDINTYLYVCVVNYSN